MRRGRETAGLQAQISALNHRRDLTTAPILK
jgi:hypothetical protein